MGLSLGAKSVLVTGGAVDDDLAASFEGRVVRATKRAGAPLFVEGGEGEAEELLRGITAKLAQPLEALESAHPQDIVKGQDSAATRPASPRCDSDAEALSCSRSDSGAVFVGNSMFQSLLTPCVSSLCIVAAPSSPSPSYQGRRRPWPGVHGAEPSLRTAGATA